VRSPPFILVLYAYNLILYRILCERFLCGTRIFVPNYYSAQIYAAALILAACDLNWRGKLRNTVVYIQFYWVTTLLELGWISALREHRFPWKTDSSWENYLLTYNLLASWARRLQSTSSKPISLINFIIILQSTHHVSFMLSQEILCTFLIIVSRHVYWRFTFMSFLLIDTIVIHVSN